MLTGNIERRMLLATVASSALFLSPACSSNAHQAQPSVTSTSAQAISGPCSIATPTEISTAIGAPITAAKSGLPDGPNGCWYYNGQPLSNAVQVMIYDTPADFDQRKASQCKISSPEPVEGVGVEASECSPDLFVKVNAERGFVVYYEGGGQARQAVARILAPRILAMQ